MTRIPVVLLALAAGLGPAARPLAAQAGWTPSVQLDNDVYNFWVRHTHRPDEQYTNGVKAWLSSEGGSWWGERLAAGTPDCAGTPAGPCRRTRVTLGQDLYTPNLDRAPYAVPGWEAERPYFAWLYLTGTAEVAEERTLRSLSVSLGVTGPPAGGELAQSVAHRIGFNEQATGWETQVGFEPGVVAEFRQEWLALAAGGGTGAGLDLAPAFAASLGNVRTHVEAGGRLRVGWNLSHPWRPASKRPDAEWWISAGGRVEDVLRDMSLDGTWGHPARSVTRVPGVTQYEFGAGVRVRHVTLEYRAATRSREYETGPGHHTYGSMIVRVVRN